VDIIVFLIKIWNVPRYGLAIIIPQLIILTGIALSATIFARQICLGLTDCYQGSGCREQTLPPARHSVGDMQ